MRRPPSDLRTRRHLWLCIVIPVLALAAACGGDDGSDAGPAGQTPTADDGAFPVTIEHKYGTTVIDEKPERVVTAGFNDADYALAFGVTPVGVRDFIGDFPEEERPWAQQALGGAELEKISNSDGTLNFELIAAAEPDVILAYSYLEEAEYEQLSQIAPTVVEAADGELWPEHTRAVGRALGQGERAEDLVAEVQDAFATAIDAHPEFAGTVAAIQFSADPTSYWLLQPADPRVGLFTSLGLVMPEQTGEVSAERVDLLDQELLVVVGLDEDAYADSELFQGLEAVREGRVAHLGDFSGEFAGALGFDSPLSLPYALEIAVPLLADALAGAPAG